LLIVDDRPEGDMASTPRLASVRSEKRLLDRRAADRIRSHILDGSFAAGARLVETQLAEELEVSRGTVRAALALLASEGLVTQVAFTRWQVSETTPRDAWEIYTLRAALEGLAARLAAGNARPADAEGLEATIAEMAQAADEGRFEAVTDLDFRLHREIVALARHRRLAEQHANIMQQVRFHMAQAGFFPADYRASVAEHAALIAAVAKGDAALAERLAHTHNETEVRLLARTAEEPRAGDAPDRPHHA
jgi:DNA-binding GntR family transcriptional regulator